MRDSLRPPTIQSLRDPRLRLGLGVAGLALTTTGVRPDRVGPLEESLFRAVNRLPDSLGGPLWLVMQSGTLAAAPVSAVVAELAGRPALARRFLVGGSSAWVLAKVIKRCFERPRPTVLVSEAKRRGREQSGLGFVSGHAAVATSLCAAALPELGSPARRAAVVAAATVALARLYTGAHLPLDVLGGIALGVAVEAAVEIATPEEPG